MPKHVDAIAPIESFRAPWETEGGEEVEIDKAKLKRYIHGLQMDKAKAQDARDAADEAKTAAETAKAAAEVEAAAQKKRADDSTGAETATALKKAEEDRNKYKTELDALKAEKAHAELKAKVIGDLEPKYAKYVTGETEEELENSLKQVREDFDLPDPDAKSNDDEDDEDGDDDSDDFSLRRQPLTNGRRGIDSDAGEKNYDFDKVAASILDGGFGF